MLPSLDPKFLVTVDADKGFICITAHWQPQSAVSSSGVRGDKKVMVIYLPCEPDRDCLCGSGKLYRECCRPKQDWQPICPDPGGRGFSLVQGQSATFSPVDGPTIRARLMADKRMQCVVDEASRSFWTFCGDPPERDQYGLVCLGDLELIENRTLLVTAISDLRMRVLLNLLQAILGDNLGSAQVRHDPPMKLRKHRASSSEQQPRRMLRFKRRRYGR